MKRLGAVLATVLSMAACKPQGHQAEDHGHGHGHAPADERPALSFTDWTDQTELFLELPALIRGKESPCAAHVTRLQPFSALTGGRVSVVLRGPDGEQRFDSPGPTVPGIFRPVAKPASTGVRRLIVEIQAEGLSATHDLGNVTVFDSVAVARQTIPEEPEIAGRIPFLKEQQWPIEFGTSVVVERPIRPTLRTSGILRARSDGEIVVTAPVAGRIVASGRAFPRPGERVGASDLLGAIIPRLEAADLASLDFSVTSANLQLRFAQRERRRLEGLAKEGAIPERRVQEAIYATEEARARLHAARQRLSQFRRVERTAALGAGAVDLRSPLAGTVTEVRTAPGAFVEAGAVLLRVTDTTQVWLEARVPEADAARVGTPSGASFIVAGRDQAIDLTAQAIVARGQVLDVQSRTLPVIFAVDNTTAGMPLGAFCQVWLVTGPERQALAVPESALVDDGSAQVVFVQVEGEAFERRVVRLGVRDRGFVEILSGVAAGEHVVTHGAWSVKLAASSGSVPAHGHSH